MRTKRSATRPTRHWTLWGHTWTISHPTWTWSSILLLSAGQAGGSTRENTHKNRGLAPLQTKRSVPTATRHSPHLAGFTKGTILVKTNSNIPSASARAGGGTHQNTHRNLDLCDSQTQRSATLPTHHRSYTVTFPCNTSRVNAGRITPSAAGRASGSSH